MYKRQIKTIAEPILNDCVMQNYAGGDYDITHQTSLPLLQIPSADPLIHNANDWHARFEAIRNTFSSRVGQISNAALDRSIIAYDENIDSETKEKCRQETETLAILTGLEIDSAKSGIKLDLSEYLSKKKVKRSSFLKYKTILESSEERRPWYEPTFDEQFKEYFGSTDWQGVSSNLEKLPYYAQMLKKNTPKAKRKPAKADVYKRQIPLFLQHKWIDFLFESFFAYFLFKESRWGLGGFAPDKRGVGDAPPLAVGTQTLCLPRFSGSSTVYSSFIK